MRQNWWKITCVILLLYVLIGGLLLPLGPRISEAVFVDKENIAIKITGVNTHFTSDTKVWFIQQQADSTIAIPALKTETSSAKEMIVYAPLSLDSMAWNLKENYVHILVNNNEDGNILYREFFYVEKDRPSSVKFIPSSEITVKTDKPAHLYFPNREILHETIRNLFYHVPMWFCMVFLLTIAFVQSIIVLTKNSIDADDKAVSLISVGVLFGMLGIFTGMIWANYTWGAPWTNDPKLNGAAMGMLVYFAYLILRNSIKDIQKKARISAVYNVFAYVIFMVFIFIMPRITDSLHPGNGGNPGFKSYDLDSTLRFFFYPAVIGWCMLGYWIYSLVYRIRKIQQHIDLIE